MSESLHPGIATSLLNNHREPVKLSFFTPVILATQEAEIGGISVSSQLGQIVLEALPRINTSQKRTGGVAQGVGPEFKSQYCQNKTNKTEKPTLIIPVKLF
jgi:hypothetical protein